jgi:hypothetical protein
MASSGNTSWELTRNQIIETAYRKLGVPGEDNVLTATQYDDGATALNSIIALLNADGMPLWKRTVATFTPSATAPQFFYLANAVKVKQVSLVDVGGVRWDIEPKSMYDYNRLPQGAIGIPVNYYFAPYPQGGSVYIWPLAADAGTIATKTIQVVYQKEFDGFFDAAETPEWPSYWMQPIIYLLAVALAPEVGFGIQDRQALAAEAKAYKDMASGYGDEDGSFYMQPQRRMK